MNQTTQKLETQGRRCGIVRSMSKALGVLIASGALLAGGTAIASATGELGGSDSGCPVISTTAITQTRQMTGVTAASTHYGPIHRKVVHRNGRRIVEHVRTVTRYTYAGDETRPATSTVRQCSGGPATTTITSDAPWSTPHVIATRTTLRVG